MWRFLALTVLFITVSCKYNYTTEWFQVPLDHFGYQRNATFKIKYLVNEDEWDTNRGPIFFYTGNEGQIELFAQHTGFMWEVAREFKAKIVFAEHRYYGASMPFGDKSLDKDHIGYLSSAQALADYADLIDHLQGKKQHPQHPVITFGGSYGGMLSAYFRMKYPHIVTGAIAASAPIHMYPDMIPCDAFNRIVTSSFRLADPHCVTNIKKSWAVIRNFTTTKNQTEWLKKEWKLCSPVNNSSDVSILMDFLQSMYVTLAMVNYPFPSDFLMPLPAQPVRSVCQYLDKPLDGQKLLEGLGKVLATFANYNGKTPCINYQKGDDYGNLDAAGWDFQACTEMVMPMCTTGQDDMFEPQSWNYTNFAAQCYDKYKVYPRPDAARLEYGGDRLQAASNIVFSNGLLDPWAAGGILNSVRESVEAVVIIDGAHHLDLMPSHKDDPISVKMARDIHKKNIHKWIREFRNMDKNINHSV